MQGGKIELLPCIAKQIHKGWYLHQPKQVHQRSSTKI